MTVLIIAAGKSDVEVIKKAEAILAENNVNAEFRVCSAHRTPEMLDEILQGQEYDVIIAAAGLAAALPGVVAAKTTTPVIGVPLTGAFEGLDALLSIIQMPPGIPVITTGVNNTEEAANAALKIVRTKAKKINIIPNSHQKAVAKATEALDALAVPYEKSGEERRDAINIRFVDISKKAAVTTNLTINCVTSEKDSATDAAKLLLLTKSGVWVGLNRGENAAVAAAEILGRKNELAAYRNEMRKKVGEADREARK